MKNLFLIIFVFSFYFNSTAQDQSININIAKPKVKAVDNKHNLRNMLYAIINESLVAQSNFITVVERDYFDLIKRKRSKLKKDDNPNVAAAIMVGANYILESKVSDVVFKSDLKKPVKQVKEARVTKYVYSESVEFTIDFELVNIETGEIDFQYRMNIDGLGYESKKEEKYNNQEDLIRTSLTQAKDCLRPVLRYMISSLTLAKTQIVDINEFKKDKAKSILINGGNNTPWRKGSKFDIVKVYSQEVGGETIEREEKIGEAKFKERYNYLSKCSVSDGKKEVLAAFQEGATLYCVPVELKHIPSCLYGLKPTARKGHYAGYNSAIKTDPDPSKKSNTITLSKKKPKSTKKVKRKSGN